MKQATTNELTFQRDGFHGLHRELFVHNVTENRLQASEANEVSLKGVLANLSAIMRTLTTPMSSDDLRWRNRITS